MEVITGEDYLLRRVVIDPSYIKPDNSISSFAFKPRAIDTDGLSVDLERLTTYEKAILDRTKFRLARLQASLPPALGLTCLHAPKEDNEAHCLLQGTFSNSVCRTLARNASFVVFNH